MHVISLPALSLRDLVAIREQSTTRTEGCHVSAIVNQMMKKLDPKRYDRVQSQRDRENWQETGFLWEDILASAFASAAAENTHGGGVVRFRPGELEKDGIIGSPDALVIDDDADALGPIVEEYKATWKSGASLDVSPEFQAGAFEEVKWLPYLLQIQAYCYLAGATRARLYIWLANGTYEHYIPATRAYFFTFSQAELETAWQGLLNNARHFKLL